MAISTRTTRPAVPSSTSAAVAATKAVKAPTLKTVSGIDDVRQLAGTFTAPKGSPLRALSLTMPEGKVDALRADGGVYKADGVEGHFTALATNPAVGSLLMLYGANPMVPRGGYFIVSSQVDKAGKVHALTLGNMETGKRFTMTRS